MILQDLFENKLSDIHAAYQDYLRLGKSQERREQFKDVWGMDPDTWVRVHQDDINKLTAHQQAQPVGDEHLWHGSAVPSDTQRDRNARIIAGELEDAQAQGNRALVTRKQQELQKLGYYFDQSGTLRSLGMYEEQLDEKQDACYHKVKSRYKVWPSAYASGALVQCRKKGAANWGNKSKK